MREQRRSFKRDLPSSPALNQVNFVSTVVTVCLIEPSVAIIGWVLLAFWSKLRARRNQEALALLHVEGLDRTRPRVLFHSASMGELEQCVPVMKKLRQLLPNVVIVSSSLSPSGFNHASSLDVVDCAVYLPISGPNKMKKFLDVIDPRLIVINRYDIWPSLIYRAQKSGVRTYLINATLPSIAKNVFTKWFARSIYRSLWQISAVTSDDAQSLSNLIGIPVDYLPDTRVDRVVEQIATAQFSLKAFRRTDVTTLVAGSTWQEDEDLLFSLAKSMGPQTLRLIIVPHEPTPDTLTRIERSLRVTRWSVATPDTMGHILVDSVGKLLAIYSLGDAAMVGGGFGAGVHSVTEPACYGLPLVCGPRIHRSADAVILHQHGLLEVASNAGQIQQWLQSTVLNAQIRAERSARVRDRITQVSGSSDLYAERITSMISG